MRLAARPAVSTSTIFLPDFRPTEKAPSRPVTLGQCLLLALLLHVWALLLLGSAPGGTARPGEGVGGAINVTLRGPETPGAQEVAVAPAPEAPVGPPGTAPTPRWGGLVREAAPTPATTEGAAQLGLWSAQPAPAAPAQPGLGAGPAPQVAPDLPALPALAAVPALSPPTPLPVPAPAPSPAPAPAPQVPAPERSLPSALAREPARRAAEPALERPSPAVALPRAAAPRLPELAPPPPALQALQPPPRTVSQPVAPLTRESVAAVAAPPPTAGPALAAPPEPALRRLAAPVPAGNAVAAPPLTPAAPLAAPLATTPSAVAPTLPAGTAVSLPALGPPATTSLDAGAPDAGARVGHDVATPPAAAASTPPRLNLDLARPRGGELSRMGSMGVLPLLPRPPELPTRLSKDIEKSGKDDCRSAYRDAGLLAVVPLAIDAAKKEGGCKW